MHQTKTPLKFATVVVASISIILLQGCSREIDARQAHVEQGLIYKKDASDPFSGTLTNVDVTKVGKRYAADYGIWEGNCAVPVKDGLFDGAAECKNLKGKKIGEFSYSKGQIEGTVKVWASDADNLMLSTTIRNGEPDGTEERFNPKTGKVISRINYRAGQKVGEEKLWDITGDNLLTDLIWESGARTGVYRYDGREEHYKANMPDGVWKSCQLNVELPAERRKPNYDKFRAYAAMAQQLGGTYYLPALVDDPSAVKCTETVYKDGVRQATAPAANVATPLASDACFDAKVAAFRKANGEDAPIMNDVMQEWEAGCKK